MRTLLIVLTLLFSHTIAAAADTYIVNGVPLAKKYRQGDTMLVLKGTTHFVYAIFIDVLIGGLYLPASASTGQVLSDVPKRLEFSYLRAFEADELKAAGKKLFMENNTPETVARLQSVFTQFNDLYRDVQPGDRYAVTYIPKEGTTLELNGQILGKIPGAEFARALFAIWFGEKPFNDGVKEDLLTGL